jgi:hypothetical protein
VSMSMSMSMSVGCSAWLALKSRWTHGAYPHVGPLTLGRVAMACTDKSAAAAYGPTDRSCSWRAAAAVGTCSLLHTAVLGNHRPSTTAGEVPLGAVLQEGFRTTPNPAGNYQTFDGSTKMIRVCLHVSNSLPRVHHNA